MMKMPEDGQRTTEDSSFAGNSMRDFLLLVKESQYICSIDNDIWVRITIS